MPTLIAVVPHPDDESYAFGGTIALAATAGWRCLVECASAGERGKRHDGGATDPGSVAAARAAELAASCALLGVAAHHTWGFPDGATRPGADDAARLAGRLAGADVVLALGADGAYGHSDHLAVYRWVNAAWALLPEPRPALLFAAFPRGLFLPQYEKVIGMLGDPPTPPRGAIGSDAADVTIDIRSVRATKLAAIACHRSQLPGGEPEALFPPGIVGALLEEERYRSIADFRLPIFD